MISFHGQGKCLLIMRCAVRGVRVFACMISFAFVSFMMHVHLNLTQERGEGHFNISGTESMMGYLLYCVCVAYECVILPCRIVCVHALVIMLFACV